MAKYSLILVLLAITVLSFNTESNAKPNYTVATGSEGAVFYPVGEAICKVVNESGLDFTCEAVATGGSVYNINSINKGIHDFAISQTLTAYDAYMGDGIFSNNKAFKKLRTVVPTHREVFMISAKKSLDIRNFADLKDKKVNLGNKSSGTRKILEMFMDEIQIDDSYFEKISSHTSGGLYDLFCNNEIDAAIYSTGHPNRIYETIIKDCNVKLVNFWDEDVRNFVNKFKSFIPAEIPANTYENQSFERQGFGTQTVLLTTTKIPENHISQLYRTLIEKKKELEEINAIFKSIDFQDNKIERMAPLHSGVKNF